MEVVVIVGIIAVFIASMYAITSKSFSRPNMLDQKFEVLARYNAEIARGLVHTPGWDLEMASLQREFSERGVK